MPVLYACYVIAPFSSAHSLVEHSCEECRRVYPSGRLLELHILESHDTLFKLMAANQNMVCTGYRRKLRESLVDHSILPGVHSFQISWSNLHFAHCSHPSDWSTGTTETCINFNSIWCTRLCCSNAASTLFTRVFAVCNTQSGLAITPEVTVMAAPVSCPREPPQGYQYCSAGCGQ